MSALTNNRFTRFFRPSEGDARMARPHWGRRVAAVLGVIVVAYLTYAFFAFSVFYGRDVHWPKEVFAEFESKSPVGGAGSPRGGEGQASSGAAVPGVNPSRPGAVDPPGGEGESGASRGRSGEGAGTGAADAGPSGAGCEPSRTVAMQQHLIRHIVQENFWAPARPLYKIGFFGVVDYEDTPFFDNKASEQIGILDVVRRMAIELTDALGRVRGTSLQNENLANAQAALRINERAWWINNPFNANLNTISPGAADSYQRAIRLYGAYNDQLARCEAVFDTRSDNLRETLSRFTATLGSTTTELAQRSRRYVYDPEVDRFVPGEGNNLAWFDMHADNYFHRARGKMYALHGILQGVRADFRELVSERNIHAVWDKMEVAIAEAAVMDPVIVSNGSGDSALAPDHLRKMAEVILRARAAMVELRDILRD